MLAMLPMVLAGWFGFEAATRATATRSATHTTVRDVNAYVEALQVRSMLLTERNWSLVVLGIADLGVPAEVVVNSTGIDPAVRLEQARQRVDERVHATFPEGVDELSGLRAVTDISTVGSG